MKKHAKLIVVDDHEAENRSMEQEEIEKLFEEDSFFQTKGDPM